MIGKPTPQSKVRLYTPDNQRLDGATATVIKLEEWGAHVATKAAATGGYRASWDEMLPLAGLNGTQNYSGDACNDCGSMRMVRTGTCLTCMDCGSTSGGCS